MASVKGVIFLNARTFALEQHGEEGWRSLLDALDPRDREELASMIAIGWYDIGLYDRVHATMERVLGKGDFALMHRLGRFSAEADLNVIHRTLMKMARPAVLFEKYPELWRRYQDSGEWSLTREDKRARGVLTGWASREEACLVRLAGGIERMLELLGARGVKVTRAKSTARGDAVCELIIDWF